MKNQKLKTYLKKHTAILEELDRLSKKHTFKAFDKTLRIEDNTVQPFSTLYHLLSDIENIQNDTLILTSLFKFEGLLSRYRLSTVIHRALTLGADIRHLSMEYFDKLLKLGDKDIYLTLSQNRDLPKEAAYKLATILNKEITYLLFYHLFENPELDTTFKKDLVTICKNAIANNPKDFALLDTLVKEYEKKY